jgi:uncharacterized DUF497 family protein
MTQRVTWTDEAAQHMLSGHGVTVAQATEALADPDALTFDPDPASKSGESVRVVGFCASRGEVITVILLHDGADYAGVNGWVAKSGRDRTAYNAQK